MKKFPDVKRDKESGLPKKYVAGLSTSTAKARAAHWKKTSKMSDSDPRAYEPAPGDVTAKTKLSKYTKKYHKMFGEQIGIVVEGAPEKIEGTNCANCIHWVKESEKPVDKSELNEYGGLKAPNEAYIAMSKHADLVTLPGKTTVKIKAYCNHDDIHDFVTERMCCAYWDGKGVKREYKGISPKMDESVELDETIVKVGNKYRLVSKKTGRNLGTYDTKAGAMKRERQVQYFKHMGEEEMKESVKTANPGKGYHGEHPADKADAKYAEMFHKVRKSIVAGNATDKKIKNYLDSTHGRHLAGRENDTEYLHKDFKRFEKTYNPEHFDEATAYKPKVGDRISTIKGGQNTGKVEKVEGGHVYFRSDYKRSTLGRGDDYYPIFKTHVSNVRLHEGAKDWQKAFKSVARKNLEKDTAYPRASVYKLDQTQKLRSTEHDDYDQIAHDVKTGKRMKEEVEQINEIGNTEKGVKRLRDYVASDRSKVKISDVIAAKRSADPDKAIDKLATRQANKAKALKKIRAFDAAKNPPQKKEPTPLHKMVYPDDMKYHGDSYEPTGNVIKEGFLSFLSKKKPTLKKPAVSHKHMRAVFSNIERQTRVVKPQQRGPVIHRSTVAAYESVEQIDERNKENKEKLKTKLRTIGVNAAITNPKKIQFGRSALTMGRDALKKLSSAEVSKASRHLPRVAEQTNGSSLLKSKKLERERRIRDTRVIHHQNRHMHQAAMGTMEESAGKSLADKAKKSGVSLATLKKVYNRGVAAWNSGHRPGTTPQQWGHARVNSYITKGKTYHTADKDLRRESVDVNEAFEREFGDK